MFKDRLRETDKILMIVSLFMFVCGVNYAHAEITIWQVENNPPGSDAGNEWLTLINTGEFDTFSGYELRTTNGRTAYYDIPLITLDTCEHYKITFPRQSIDNDDDTVKLLKQGSTIYETPVIRDTKNNDRFWTNPSVKQTCDNLQPNIIIPKQTTGLELGEKVEILERKIEMLEKEIRILTLLIQRILDVFDMFGMSDISPPAEIPVETIQEEESTIEQKTGDEPAVAYKEGIKKGIITKVVDGDTVDISNIRYRLNLIDTPERGESGFTEATNMVKKLCPVDSIIYYDDDDITPVDIYDRRLGVIWCSGSNYSMTVGEHLYILGMTEFYYKFCRSSEAATSEWAAIHGDFYHKMCFGDRYN